MIEFDEAFFRYQKGHTISQIARSVGQSRDTVRKYLGMAREAGLTVGGDDAQRAHVVAAVRARLAQTRTPSAGEAQQLLAPHAERMRKLLGEEDMTIKQVWRLLREDRPPLPVSYPSVKRFVQRHLAPKTPRTTVRLETPPGRQAQVDFGQVHLRLAGQRVRLWAFVMTLAFSRHRFVRFVERQDLQTWIDCHVRAFAFFGGVPETILLDNLKAGVVRPDRYDPTVNRAYAELERHYGFVVDPTRVATPEHKGKVERTMPTLRQQLAAGRDYADLAAANEAAWRWCREGVGREPHGTTQEPPLVRFERQERAALLPLPPTAFACPVWAEAKVHPDHHLVFARSYYSVPTRFVGKTVWVRATARLVEIFLDDALIKTHPLATRRGTWVTDESDYPDAARAYLMAHPQYCRKKAVELGAHAGRFVEAILSDHAIRNLRKAQAVLRLGEKYGAARLDEACQYLLSFDTTELRRLQRVLDKGVPSLWRPQEPTKVIVLSQQALSFLHPAQSFAAPGGQVTS
jgi:transposase